ARAARRDRGGRHGAARTFDRDIAEIGELIDRLTNIAAEVARRLASVSTTGRTVTLKIKYHDFTISTRSHTLYNGIAGADELLAIGTDLLKSSPPKRAVRLLGLTVSGLREIGTERKSGQMVLELG
ncbi:MAG: DNA polymerase IV, partial [Candidatus Kapaibacterium sp.]